jgi:lipopolysaccharide export system permease protein
VRILSRYFVARFLASFLVLLAVFAVAIAVVDVLTHLDDVLQAEHGLDALASYVFLRVPSQYFSDLVPVAAFAASLFTLGSAARWLEVTAIKSGGVSPHRVVAPILACGLALSALAFAVDETLVLEASRAWSRRLAGEGDTASFRRGTFWYHRGDTVYNFAQADDATRTLRGVTVFRLDGSGRLARKIEAESVRIEEGNRWRLLHATIRDFDPVRWDGPVRTEHVAETVLVLGSERELALESADAAQLSLGELRESIAVRERKEQDVGRSLTLYHGRLAGPLAVVLLVLIGAPLGLRVEQTRSLSSSALWGVAALAAFFVLRGAVDTLAGEGVLPARAAPWLVPAAFASVGLWRLARIAR